VKGGGGIICGVNDSKDLFDEMIGDLPAWLEVVGLVVSIILAIIFAL